MHLHAYRLKNFRRLKEARIELADDISIFVGANNSGKTSATQALQIFLKGDHRRLTIFDFSSHAWKVFDQLADEAGDGGQISLPTISLDVWFSVAETDLHLVVPLLPSTSWAGTEVGIRIEFASKNPAELLQKFKTLRDEAKKKAEELEGGAGAYQPWPKNLTDYLLDELGREYDFNYFVLDRKSFGPDYKELEAAYQPAPMTIEPGGRSVVRSLIRIDNLNAQRHLADPSPANLEGGRSEDLSKRLSRFYQRNLDQRQEDHSALRALFNSEVELNTHLEKVFEPTFKRLEKLGYPGLNNPKLQIKSALNPATVMSQDARVHYVLDGDASMVLPDTYNGLGFKNLIYMVVEILDLQAQWLSDEDRAPLHLIFIEEPEAHLHAQLQQVFIRNVLDLLKMEGQGEGAFHSQIVVTTHSPHILYERGFRPIRYFRRHHDGAQQTTTVLNLSSFYSGADKDDRDFLQRYLKLTHCDLFFADAAILVEGNVERLLMPVMIEKEAVALRSASICILEVGGAFGHKFKSLIEFLGLTVLIITDLDSVAVLGKDEAADDDRDTELEIGDAEGKPQKKVARSCLPSIDGALSSNQTLRLWLPKKHSIAELFAATPENKSHAAPDTGARVRVTYQVPCEIEWAGKKATACGRTLEEAFGLENATWCQSEAQRHLGLKLKINPETVGALAVGLNARVSSSSFNKTNFALAVLTQPLNSWIVPSYIREGLEWLLKTVEPEPILDPKNGLEGGAAE